MKQIEVSAGVVRDQAGHVLICRRKGALDGLWEFPGGKREAGESFAECLKRELLEELELPVTVGRELGEVIRAEEDRTIRLVFLEAVCEGVCPGLPLHVHGLSAWVEPREFSRFEFCPADARFLQEHTLL